MRRKTGRLVAIAVFASMSTAHADVNWTGTTSTSWATGTNWSNSAGPATTDVVDFNNPGSATTPGNVTSLLNTSRTIGGLNFNINSGHYQTLDLGTHVLSITGNLNFNLDEGSSSTATVRNGTITITGPFASLNVGRTVGGSASSSGIADLTGLSALNATLQVLDVGASVSGGASGTLMLSPSNTISAQLVQVGAANSSSDTNGTLTLGQSNNISAGEMDIGKDNSIGLVNIVNGGALSLGTAAQPTLLQIANQNTNTNNTYSGILNLGSAAVNLQLGTVIVAEKNGGPGGAVGQLLGGGSGGVTIGSAAAPANWYVGYTVNGGGTAGTVDFSGLNTLNAYVNNLWIGESVSGSATGIVSLAANSTINASTGIVVGSGVGDGSGTLTLGKTTALLTPSLTVGQNYTNGLVQIASGGTLNLGSAAQRTSIYLGNDVTNTNNTYTGELNFTGATLNAYVNQVIVGLRDGPGGGGPAVGTWLAGNGGSIDIGPAGNTANFYVGRSITNSSATGTVDFSGLNSLNANVNTLALGTVTVGGSAQGVLSLATNNSINANSIVVGSGGGGNNVLTLGKTNTILANQLIIAQDYSNGTITLPANGTLSLGSPSARTSIFIANGTTNTNNTYAGSLDVSNGVIVAYLGNVVLGTKNAQPGNEQATFSIGANSANMVDATSIALGGNQSVGTLKFGGGVLYAGSITAGPGTAVFNWTGGRASIGSFGQPATPFNLQNIGTGVLAPGSDTSAVGTTTVYGNYNQGSAATTAIDIGDVNTGNDQLNISGSATLAGTLSLNLLNGFVPAIGQNYLLATYASHTGSYGFVVPPTLPAGEVLKLDYSTPTQLVLSFVPPTPTNYVSPSAFGSFSTPASWSTFAAPSTFNSTLLINNGSSSKTVTVSSSTTIGSLLVQGSSATMELDVSTGVEVAISSGTTIGTNGIFHIATGGSVLALNGISGAGTTVVLSGATLNSGFIRQGTLSIGGVATIQQMLPKNSVATVSVISNLTIAGTTNAWTGKLDLTNNDLDVQNATLGIVSNQIKTAYNSGTWSGNGITSSEAAADTTFLTTLGVIANTTNGTNPLYGSGTSMGLFDGINPAANDVLVKYTYYGDTNLDGRIDGSDYSRTDNGFLTHASGWYNGDFNYDDVVDGSDYTLLDNAFNMQGASLSTQISGPAATSLAQISGSTSVPEPAAMAIVLLGAGVLRRRRR
jgi:hypothetical protein